MNSSLSVSSVTFAWLAAAGSALCGAGLPAQQPSGKPKSVKLKAATFDEAAAVPLSLRAPIEADGMPPIQGHRVPVEIDGKKLRLDLDGDGRFEKRVSGGKPTVVDVSVGEREIPVLIARDEAGYWCVPAACLVGRYGRKSVLMLDADGDGTFDGAGDWLRFGSGSLYRVVTDMRWLGDGEVIASYEFVDDGKRQALTVQPLGPEPGTNDLQWRALMVANAFRTAAGLPPTRLDLPRCDGCQKHAEYLKINNYDYSKPWDGVGSHDEVPGKPGYTKEGHEAARTHATGGRGDAAATIVSQTATMLHRLPYLGEPGSGLGVGAVDGANNGSATGYSVVGGPRAEPENLSEVVVVPAPGQKDVRKLIRRERPRVEDDPAFYQTARGYPVSVTFGRLAVTNSDVKLFDARGKPVPGRCFTPQKWIHSTRKEQGGTSFFVADKPLDGGTRYTAEFTADYQGRPIRWRWSFFTQ